jgi:hypothetical protein
VDAADKTGRKAWNENQQALKQALAHPEEHARAVELFLSQHAALHDCAITPGAPPGFSDLLWQGLSEAAARRIPPGAEHSIAWMLWHIARIEDITMNMLAAGAPQLFHAAGWQARLNAQPADTGNAMTPAEVASLSAAIDLDALRDYRQAVGARTREIARGLAPQDVRRRVRAERIARVLAEGAVLPSEGWLTDYWGGLTIAGLLLMPPTRHNFVHLNEAMRAKARKT